MNILFVASVAIVTAEPAHSRKLFIDAERALRPAGSYFCRCLDLFAKCGSRQTSSFKM
jgi:hypothetical protein